MRFIQNFKDNFFIADCETTMKRIAPETQHTAQFFCEDYRGQLLARKATGSNALAALCVVTAKLLDGVQVRIDNGLSYGEFQALMDASHFGRAMAASNSATSKPFASLIGKFAIALESEQGRKLLGNRSMI